MKRRPWAEPFKIKMVEHLKMTTRAERKRAIADAGFNTFLLRSEDVYIDLLTDSGTSAMSDRQWAALMMGDEAYAGSVNYYHLEDAVRRHYGYRNVVPTHQGRGAEHILSRMLIKPGDVVPGNMYFTTTKAHQELAGGRFVDVIVDAAHDPDDESPFKGNIDLAKLERVIEEVGAERIPYVNVQCNVNMAGGQPISLANLRSVRALCQRNGIRVMLDATRAVENAYFIKQREPGHERRSLSEILLEICSLTDGCTNSAKKDCLVNIGGFLCLNDDALAEQARNLVVVFEGLHTYGGLAGRDMEAMAVGIEESVQEEHMHARIGQVEYLGRLLLDAGVPIVKPIGGHGIFLNALRILPHVPRNQFPAQALAAALYVDSGVRAMERGAVSAGRDKQTGENIYPALELVRLTIPRRVYSQAHMDVTADSVIDLFTNAERVVGLRFTRESEHLRFFQSRFAPVVGTTVLREPSHAVPSQADEPTEHRERATPLVQAEDLHSCGCGAACTGGGCGKDALGESAAKDTAHA
ncbi:MAG: tyrosine phenol-lyase [Phycisphaerales bacterium]|nr:tyrosine phenol-lyase [Phycisphaerales bacterium]